MRQWARFASTTMLVLAAIGIAHASAQVEVTGTYPSGDNVTLGLNQNFYLHLRYTSDQPVQIWARPYFDGKQADAGSNPSRVYPAGSGEALGWFFLVQRGGQVDEVRISAGDGSPDGTRMVATYPVSIANSDDAAQASPQPTWVTDLGAADAAAQRADYEKRMNTPTTAADVVFFSAFMLTVAALGMAGFAWPVWAVWRWRGGWRLVSAVPLAIVGFLLVRIFIGVSLDRTSHNLWPFEVLMASAVSVALMLVLLLARLVIRPKGGQGNPD